MSEPLENRQTALIKRLYLCSCSQCKHIKAEKRAGTIIPICVAVFQELLCSITAHESKSSSSRVRPSLCIQLKCAQK